VNKDMEWMGNLLYQHKLAASMATSAVLESGHPEVRSHFTNLLNTTLHHQQQIFDLMNRKGWYQMEMASPDQYNRVQQSLSSIQQQMQQ
jgi:spore coat protein CotF